MEHTANVLNGKPFRGFESLPLRTKKLRAQHGFWFWWKQEGTRLKYFRDKATQKAFARNLDSLERIDKAIEKDVKSALEKAAKRAEKLAQNRP